MDAVLFNGHFPPSFLPSFLDSALAVHYTFMSTEHPYTPGSPQYEWLQQDLTLANQNRANVPWIILTGWWH